jgi:hypothetical protein
VAAPAVRAVAARRRCVHRVLTQHVLLHAAAFLPLVSTTGVLWTFPAGCSPPAVRRRTCQG